MAKRTKRAERDGRRVSVRALLACGIVLGLGSTSTLAAWTTGASKSPGTIQAGKLDLVVNTDSATINHVDTTTVDTYWQLEDLVAGEVMPLSMTVSNTGAGTMPFDFQISAYASNDVTAALTLRFVEGATFSTTWPHTNIVASDYRWLGCSGGQVMGGTLSPGIGASNAVTLLNNKRRLAPGDSVNYCIRLALPDSADVYDNLNLLDRKGSLTLVIKATQVGA